MRKPSDRKSYVSSCSAYESIRRGSEGGGRETSNAIYEITGEYPVYIRPPFGEWREGLDLAVTMIPVLWDVDSRDWESQNTASICSAVLPNVKDGSIILMHDGYRATVEALRRIVKELKEEGYTFVTVRELIEE